MRSLGWLVVALVVAGCVGADPETSVPRSNGSSVEAPEDNATLPAPSAPIGERMPSAMERFVFLENHTLGVLASDAPEMPIAKVPESLSAVAFWESFAQPLVLAPWSSFAFRVPFEATAEIDVSLNIVADAPAVSTNPKAAGFPAVGGWVGTPERFAFFVLAQDAPDTLEAGKVYTVHLKATPPKGGFFVRAEEQLALYTFLSYQTAEGKTASYVVGGPDPAGFRLAHNHFNVSAPRAIVVVDETGEIGPNPGPTGDTHNAPVNIPVIIPPEAVYAVLEVEGTPKVGSRIDVDGSLRTAGGEVITGGSGPNAREVAVVGPGNLQAFGRDLVAHVTCSACPAGGTWSLKVTAYAP